MIKNKKPNTRKIRLSMNNPKISENINEGVKLSQKKSFDDATVSKEKDEFWGDCLESNIKFNNYNNHTAKFNSTGLKKKPNSVVVEANNDLGLVREVDSNKEETGRRTAGSQIEGYLTFKKERLQEDPSSTAKNAHNLSTGEIISTSANNNSGTIGKNVQPFRVSGGINKSRQEKFKELLTKMGQTDEEIYMTKGTSGDQKYGRKVDRCHALYEKGKMKNELNKIMYQKNKEAKEEKLVSECTFKPRTNSVTTKEPKEKVDPKTIGSQMYDRLTSWKKQNLEKFEKAKQEKEAKVEVPSFKPQIHKANKEALFNPQKNVKKDDKISKKFFSRLENARAEETKKKERFENLGKVKPSILSNAEKQNHPVHVKTSSLDIHPTTSHEGNGNGQLDDLVKNLRRELQDINLNTNNVMEL